MARDWERVFVLPMADAEADPERVGDEGAALARLAAAGLPVAPGFHVTAGAWRRFMAAAERHHGELPTEVAGPIRWEYAALGDRDAPVSVRSAVRDVEGVRGEAALLRAVRECWVDPAGDAVPLLVQAADPAEATGTLATAAPVSGSRDQVVIRTGGDVLVADKESGRIFGRRGTGRPALTSLQAGALVRIGAQAEELLGGPVELEWAVRAGAVALLGVRPLTGLPDDDDVIEIWNDAVSDDRVWSNEEVVEIVPDVMTPCTWSLLRAGLPGRRAYGRIGGRLYLDLGMAVRLGLPVEVPPGVRLPQRRARRMRPATLVRKRLDRRRLRDFLAESPARCDVLGDRIASATTPAQLVDLWWNSVRPAFVQTRRMLLAAGRPEHAELAGIRADLTRLAGAAEASAMLTGLRSPDGTGLASMGPVTGLARLAQGEIDRYAYVRQWGHRGPHEFEVAAPRLAEDPDWAARMEDAGRDAAVLLERQRLAARDAWRRFRERHPRRVTRMRRRIGRWARAEHAHEAVRSEAARMFWVLRAFVRRAGELTLIGDDAFFLSFDELLDVLSGDPSPVEDVPVRRRTYERYRALPPYPTLIRGAFDPFAWATAPQGVDAMGDAVSGVGGSAGTAEGVVRVLGAPEEGDALRDGEILVAHTTNVGWSPLFTRAAAVVTDLGAAASHAAAEARELGIPAVVGTGDATGRLRTGDRVLVDGERGVVTLLVDRRQPREG
ncbi:PEP-utilizing enzyme [Actinomadura macrotermitis]|uniref:PEP-utilising enzyme mobile domain-containing protein n=1 Tax=Actinomadura macrotermitis TaxID=2585200 RepID=A0A7K0BU07_9ACTN|nr:PEP-utilizing enzyme [Actinomadura macrotermitis]MQY04382.1 hypothetical protein [Actinomadura macrotermitis]